MTTVRIHHATATKAEKEGVALRLMTNAEGTAVAVEASKGKTTVSDASAKDAMAWCLLGETLRAEYPILSVRMADGIPAVHHGDTLVEIGTDGGVPDLADVQEACDEMGLDPEEETTEEDDEEKGGGVVPAGYKKAYAERGNANHCGDWIAKKLEGAFDTQAPADEGNGSSKKRAKPGFDRAAFDLWLLENGVPMEGRWTTLPETGGRGWQGRYRMNGRQIAEKHIARAGFMMYGGHKHGMPKAVLEEYRTKHAKWIAAQQRKDDAKAAAEASTEA